ncbi:L,D-transpeptidase family protein [Streptomyces sp. PU10]|uniref:L,D-transpeptidase family protein n=1 Tax=Streptomyces TaxID=1883 RepID=UPI0015921035|nr:MULTISPECIES: L,D-transpeptidase family protein [unclassified Streptomyces]MDU0252714.1 L,D-transpeptidase family protein [Streptomyces sp. PU10]QKW64518.1 L,D-transpeptidase family protein [Streptomyces sp. NA03103]WSU04895.1 L,D-transpeptidase family protein [Streptomyces sp. NBC_01124]
MLSEHATLPIRRHKLAVAVATCGALLLTTGCGADEGDAAAEQVAADAGSGSTESSAPATASPSASASASASPSPSATPSDSASPSTGAAASKAGEAGDADDGDEVGNATQVITVEARGSYATVTAWAKGSAGWKARFSTAAGRVGSNGVTNGATRRQGTWTTPTGTYTITEGFGVEASGTSMPYHVVTDDDWWVEDPESKFYNSMHSAQGADFPLTESGDRGSEHLVDYPTQYAEALVINFNRWPATPGRGAGIFLHVNGSGATAGCVSVPRATMDRFMNWIEPSAHPRIAIG